MPLRTVCIKQIVNGRLRIGIFDLSKTEDVLNVKSFNIKQKY